MTELGTNIEPVTINKPRKPTTAGADSEVTIILEENDDIPPTGLFLGHNGRSYLVRTGEPVTIPVFLREILDHAITSVPQIDPQTRQVVGYRDRLRFPYRLVHDATK